MSNVSCDHKLNTFIKVTTRGRSLIKTKKGQCVKSTKHYHKPWKHVPILNTYQTLNPSKSNISFSASPNSSTSFNGLHLTSNPIVGSSARS